MSRLSFPTPNTSTPCFPLQFVADVDISRGGAGKTGRRGETTRASQAIRDAEFERDFAVQYRSRRVAEANAPYFLPDACTIPDSRGVISEDVDLTVCDESELVADLIGETAAEGSIRAIREKHTGREISDEFVFQERRGCHRLTAENEFIVVERVVVENAPFQSEFDVPHRWQTVSRLRPRIPVPHAESQKDRFCNIGAYYHRHAQTR